MDYEKKYKDAFEIARKINSGEGVPAPEGWSICEVIFPELRESEDERIRKELITHCRNTRCVTEEGAEQIATWLAWLEKQGEQKPTDKVEPKFKVGDWVACEELNTALIVKVDDDKYEVEFIDGNKGFPHIDYIDSNYHLWVIDDAKDGDVLVEDSCIFIIQKLGDNNTAAKTYCTLYDDGDFDNGSILYFDIDSTKPATKELRDLLFQKMKEAGYMWDSEKKELREIEKQGEQKPVEWSEEDEKIYQTIIDDTVQENQLDGNQIHWLKTLRYKSIHLPKWSEDDEKNWCGIIDEIKANKSNAPDYDIETYDRFLSWMYNIKQRMEEQQ